MVAEEINLVCRGRVDCCLCVDGVVRSVGGLRSVGHGSHDQIHMYVIANTWVFTTPKRFELS